MAEQRGGEFQAVVACMLSLAVIAMCLRLYTRLYLVKAFGWDDGWMAFATLTHIMFSIFVFIGVHHGYGHHTNDLNDTQILLSLRSWWVCYMLYCITMISAKISIGLFLLRITPNRTHYWIICTSVGCTIIVGLAFLFITVFQCRPVSLLWDKAMREKGGTCINVMIVAVFTYVYSICSALTDFAFGILPIVLVWNLNMTRRQKIALIPILSMGCIACVAVVVRMAYIPRFITDDFLYATVDIAIWSDVEQGLAITAGSLATLRPLYKMVTNHFGLSTTAPSRKSKDPIQYVRSASSEGRDRRKKGTLYNLTTLMHGGKEEDEEHVLGPCSKATFVTVDERSKRDGEGDLNEWETPRTTVHTL